MNIDIQNEFYEAKLIRPSAFGDYMFINLDATVTVYGLEIYLQNGHTFVCNDLNAPSNKFVFFNEYLNHPFADVADKFNEYESYEEAVGDVEFDEIPDNIEMPCGTVLSKKQAFTLCEVIQDKVNEKFKNDYSDDPDEWYRKGSGVYAEKEEGFEYVRHCSDLFDVEEELKDYDFDAR